MSDNGVGLNSRIDDMDFADDEDFDMTPMEHPPIPESAEDEVVVPEDAHGLRLDVFLTEYYGGTKTRAEIQRCIQDGHIKLRKRVSRPADKVHTNDKVHVTWPEYNIYVPQGERLHLNILYEDEEMLVINKPPGMVVHPARGNWKGTVVNALLAYDPHCFEAMLDQFYRPGIVHRLDKDTSGALVVAKNLDARHELKLAFKERQTEKTYLTLVTGGEFGKITGRFESLIGRHPVDRVRRAVVETNGKEAITNYRVLATNKDISLVQVKIETGRTHQIRVHFSHAMHPVLGDDIYGPKRQCLPIKVKRQMLHAWRIAIPHPVTGVMMEFMAPPPDDFINVLKALDFPRFQPKKPRL